jgi:cytoskeletal protein RodZ
MNLKIFTGLKTIAIITVAISGFGFIANWDVPAGPSYQTPPDQKESKQQRVVVAQSETRTTPKEETAPASESSASESKTPEKKESAGTQEKPLEKFRPSERIEAEQAVDFPYDI